MSTSIRRLVTLFLLSCGAAVWMGPAAHTQTAAPRVQATDLTYLGAFKLPTSLLGSTNGMGYAGTGGLGTYVVAFNPANNSLFLGGHPYEQKVAEFKIPSSLAGTPTAAVLQNLKDPLEGKLGSINPGDPNSKVIGTAFVTNGRLVLGAYSYYDGAATQSKSHFSRPTDLSVTGQVAGPVQVGSKYPGWVNRAATAIPAEWQAAFGGPALAGGGGGAINSLQSWGPAATVFNPAAVTGTAAVAGTLVLGYPYGNPLINSNAGNELWQQTDTVNGMAFIAGTRSVLFFGYHGMGAYCYGTGGSAGECRDPDDSSKGVHAYPYRSQVWAYDANDLIAVKNGSMQPHLVKPYAVWELSPLMKRIQGVGYDPATQTLYVSHVMGDGTQPLIRVYKIAASGTPPQTSAPQAPLNVRIR